MGNHNNLTAQSNSSLQYGFTLDGGRSNQLLSLVNTTSSPITVQAIQITTNANITSPWQLFGEQWGAVEVTTTNNLNTYTLNLSSPVTLQPGQTNVLEYSVGTALGPITNVSMPPQQVQIQLQGQSSWQPLPYNNVSSQPNPQPNKILRMYHANWGQYAYNQNENNEAWTDINEQTYAFIGLDINGDGGVLSLDNWADQLELPLLALYKQQYPYLKTTLSFGGWTNAGTFMAPVFSQMTANPTALNNFVNNAVAAVNQANADGIDIDWEYPASAADATNFIMLLTQLRAKLPAGKKLTITAGAGIDKIKVFTQAQWQQIAALVDEIAVMSYDYFGAFSTYSDFHAPYKLSPNSPNYSDPILGQYNVADTYAAFQQLGVPASKIIMGIPNYARSVIVDQAGEYAGLYQPVTQNVPQGDFPGANGVYSWNSIQAFLNKQPSPLDELGVTDWNYYDSTHSLCADANMCLLSGQLPNGQWVVINFPDPTSMNCRAQQSVSMGLGGAMVWANYFESTNPKNKIVDAVSAGLNGNTLSYDLPQQNANPMTTQKTQSDQKVQDHANYLRDAFFGKAKQKVLNQLLTSTSALNTETIILKNKSTLSQHRNLFKRALAAILPTSFAELLLGKAQSLELAERLLVQRKVVDKTKPTRIIPADKNKPHIVNTQIKNSDARIMPQLEKQTSTDKSAKSQPGQPSFGYAALEPVRDLVIYQQPSAPPLDDMVVRATPPAMMAPATASPQLVLMPVYQAGHMANAMQLYPQGYMPQQPVYYPPNSGYPMAANVQGYLDYQSQAPVTQFFDGGRYVAYQQGHPNYLIPVQGVDAARQPHDGVAPPPTYR